MWRSLRLLLASLPLAACATMGATARSYVTTSDGLLMDDARVRQLLAAERPLQALTAVRDRHSHLSPDDQLLRTLYEATAARYAGQPREAGQLFDKAFALSEDRFTKSVTRTATALLTNDLALPYTAGWSERLLIHYNAMLAWSAAGDRDAAAVEARRLVALLGRIAPPEPGERPVRAMLHAIAGAAFAAAGEPQDALVAYRNAASLGAPVDTVATAVPADSGDVLVAVERGFVAHKVAVGLTLPIFSNESPQDWDGRFGARAVSDRLLLDFGSLRNGGIWWDDVPSWRFGGNRLWIGSNRVSYVLDMSWPVMRRARPLPLVAPRVDATNATGAALVTADISEALAGDYRRDRGAIMSRTLARAAAKYVATEAAEAAAKSAAKPRKKGKKGDDDDLGWRVFAGVVGALANGAAMYLERADTRAWSLLPGQVTLVRVRMPAGTHDVRVRVGDAVAVAPAVPVAAGRTTLASVRIWRERAGDALLTGGAVVGRPAVVTDAP
ncbi:MAG: hypothetical protein MUF21_01375 [Gemmatimonadaceae bacterium]|nr:hypothetical protein [Gemmatimonadaceae bacterium]